MNRAFILKLCFIILATVLYANFLLPAYAHPNKNSGMPFDLQWGDSVSSVEKNLKKYTNHCKVHKLNDGKHDYILLSKVLLNGFPFTVLALADNDTGLVDFCLAANTEKNQFKEQFEQAVEAVLTFLEGSLPLKFIENIEEQNCYIQINKCGDYSLIILSTFFGDDPQFVVQWKPTSREVALNKFKITKEIEDIKETLNLISR